VKTLFLIRRRTLGAEMVKDWETCKRRLREGLEFLGFRARR